jgi:hypothetical protein
MYTEVTCWNTGNSYLVTDTENVPTGVRFYNYEDGFYTPVKYKREYVIRKNATKPSIYKRSWLQCRKDEYKYAFTERTVHTTVKDKDVYYNEDRDRFISKTRCSHTTRTEYGLPRLIVF